VPHCPDQEQAGAAADQPPGEDALAVMLESVLSLAYALVSGGPWWEEARAKHSLLLVEALFATSRVSQNGSVPGAAYGYLGCTAMHAVFYDGCEQRLP
jgi:hypothetical protein